MLDRDQLSAKSVEGLRQAAATMSATAVAAVAADGGDILTASSSLATQVMCRLLGVPEEDLGTFVGWADALSPVFFMMTPDQIAAASTAIVDLLAYVGGVTERRRHDPGPDLITALLAAEHEGDRLTHDEVVAMVANLIVAGHDTTTSQIGCTLLTLLGHPDASATLRRRPDLLASAVSETIRLEPSLPVFPRTALAPIAVDGVELPAGSLVLLCSGSANRDPEVWKDPDRFDPERFSAPGCPRLLSFGAGPHYCLGAALARVTLEELVRAVVACDPPLRLTEAPAAIPWRVILGRSPARLPVTTEAA